MDKEMECGVALRLNIFNIYWNIMKKNYKDTQHTEHDFKIYYSIFKEYQEQDFIYAIKMVLKYQSYFPRIDEIVKYLPKIDEFSNEKNSEKLPKWFNEKNEIRLPNKEEQEELENIIANLIN